MTWASAIQSVKRYYLFDGEHWFFYYKDIDHDGTLRALLIDRHRNFIDEVYCNRLTHQQVIDHFEKRFKLAFIPDETLTFALSLRKQKPMHIVNNRF